MIKHQVQGKIVFVGSTLSLMGLVGYSQYAPSKAALKSMYIYIFRLTNLDRI